MLRKERAGNIARVSAASPNQPSREVAKAAWLATFAFLTYFCAYAMRKPWSALEFEGDPLWGISEPRTVLALSQLVGYTVSKYLGTKVCSEVSRRTRLWWMVGLVAIAEIALLLFAVLPISWKPVALFVNGLPLGMVWGLVIRYLEGRRASEILMAALSCSYIISSGIVKDVARWLQNDMGIARDWVPVTEGAIFLPLFAVMATILHRAPPPNEADRHERVARRSMDGAERLAFLRVFGLGIFAQCLLYFFVTAFRDFRDSNLVPILTDMGNTVEAGSLSAIELPVGFTTLAVMGALTFVRDNRLAVRLQFGAMILGGLIVAGSTWAWSEGVISGPRWLLLNGIGGYLAYVWSGATLFDRIVAASRHTGTAVFAIYVLDAFGYTGSILWQLLRGDADDISWLDYFVDLCWISAGITVVLGLFNLVWFDRRTAREAAHPVENSDS